MPKKILQKVQRLKAFSGHQLDIEDTDYIRSGGKHVFGPYNIEGV